MTRRNAFDRKNPPPMTDRTFIMILLVVLLLYGMLGSFDYEDDRAEDCAAQGLYYDPEIDQCYFNKDTHHAPTT